MTKQEKRLLKRYKFLENKYNILEQKLKELKIEMEYLDEKIGEFGFKGLLKEGLVREDIRDKNVQA